MIGVDDERTVTDDRSADEGREGDRASRHASGASPGDRSVDRAASSFLDVEAELAAEAGVSEGLAVGARRVAASAVPEGYPLGEPTSEALALDVELDVETVTVYVPWDLDGALGDLLTAAGVAPERFADLHGKRVLVRREDSHHVPVLPDGSERGDPRAVYGLLVAFALTLGGWVLVAAGLGGTLASLPVVAGWLAAGLFGLPAGTYLDAWHLREHTDWDQGPLFWTFLAAIPGLNVATTLLYLYGRRRSTPAR